MYPLGSYDKLAEVRGRELRAEADRSRLVANCPRRSVSKRFTFVLRFRRGALGRFLVKAGLRLERGRPLRSRRRRPAA